MPIFFPIRSLLCCPAESCAPCRLDPSAAVNRLEISPLDRLDLAFLPRIVSSDLSRGPCEPSIFQDPEVGDPPPLPLKCTHLLLRRSQVAAAQIQLRTQAFASIPLGGSASHIVRGATDGRTTNCIIFMDQGESSSARRGDSLNQLEKL
jgi:hypothetical protein